MRRVALPSRSILADKQDVAIFSDEEKQQAVNEPQEGAVIHLGRQLPVTELRVQIAIPGTADEAATEYLDGRFDAVAQSFERARALLRGRLRPPLKPALRRRVSFDARLVADEPEHSE